MRTTANTNIRILHLFVENTTDLHPHTLFILLHSYQSTKEDIKFIIIVATEITINATTVPNGRILHLFVETKKYNISNSLNDNRLFRS